MAMNGNKQSSPVPEWKVGMKSLPAMFYDAINKRTHCPVAMPRGRCRFASPGIAQGCPKPAKENGVDLFQPTSAAPHVSLPQTHTTSVVYVPRTRFDIYEVGLSQWGSGTRQSPLRHLAGSCLAGHSVSSSISSRQVVTSSIAAMFHPCVESTIDDDGCYLYPPQCYQLPNRASHSKGTKERMVMVVSVEVALTSAQLFSRLDITTLRARLVQATEFQPDFGNWLDSKPSLARLYPHYR
ncbi:hypothetical protein QR685DRAFT_541339 [Neurospora intermedia]|uniref:Uncharacterized protein n=1 Tax=Neurospora intermedia TaxID=5142 RepID=A0ABR3DTZ5_NEUIN